MEQSFAVRLICKGKARTRHVWATGADQAVTKACPKKSGRRAIGVRKIRTEDVIGEVNEFKMIKEILGTQNKQIYGVLESDTTLDSIVFGKKFDVRNDRVNDRREEDDIENLWYAKKNKIEK